MRVFLVPTPGLPALLPAMRAAIEAAGHELVNDPAAAPLPGLAQAERQAFAAAVDRMLEADAVVADVSEESFTAGWCVSWFLAKGRLAVLPCRRDRRPALAFLAGGNPSPWQRIVPYDAPADLEKALLATLGPR